jgi:Protein of unknown function (DUF3592)
MNRFVALLLGLALLAGAAYFAKDTLRLQRHGVAVTGIVVDAQSKHEINYSDHHGISQSNSNSATVEFTPENGTPVRFISQTWSRQHIGEQVKVLYSRDDPKDARIDSYYAWFLPVLLGIFGIVLLLCGLGIMSGDDSPSYDSDRTWTLFRWFD